MNPLRLKISNLLLDVDLSKFRPGVYDELCGTFAPFMAVKGPGPHETLSVMPLGATGKKRVAPGFRALMKKGLETPLHKFPFPPDPEKQVRKSLRCLRSFSRDAGFQRFLEDSENPGEAVIYPLNMGCLLRKEQPAGSALFLRTGYFRKPRIESIREATHITAAMALPLVDCMMLHGVGIRREGRGYLFLGTSGGGKTTLARFSPPGEVISDDGIIVEQEGSGYSLSQAPIDQSFSYRGPRGEYPTGGTALFMGFFLQKDRRVYLEKVLPSDACSIILKNHIHYFRSFPPWSVEKTFHLISGLCRKVPFYRLHFRKEPSFWPVILGEMSRVIQD